MNQITIEDINRLLNIDGKTVKAVDVVSGITPEQALKIVTYIIGKLS